MLEVSQKALSVFQTLCDALDEDEIKYQITGDIKLGDLKLKCSWDTDLPININVYVDDERDVVMATSQLPFTVPQEQRENFALALCYINYYSANGSFEFNPLNGNAFYRITNSYKNSLLGKDAFRYVVYTVLHMVNNYNDKLFALSKGLLSLEKLKEIINE